ncbi:MAG: hypothetical protein Q7R88_02990 [bacterium]|nr:hypothetical protein [bacterium]
MSDAAKSAQYGVDRVRSDRDYPSDGDETAAWQGRFSAQYLEPTREQLDAARAQILQRTTSGEMVVTIPFRERDNTVGGVLDALAQWLPPASILVVENGSSDEAISAVRERAGVRLAYQDDLLDTLDWARLLPLLKIDKRPKGKGVAVLAGSLFWHFMVRAGRIGHPQWIMAHDAEIRECDRYRSVEHLVWATLQRQSAHYAKTAKYGRTNSACMTARSMLAVLANAPGNVDPQVRRRAADLFERLVPHKWMLTGEFMMRFELVMRRPFATGFLEETLASTFAEDLGASTGAHTVHVANPNPRMDAANTRRKERMMQQQISNFILLLAVFGIPTHEWTSATIEELNRNWMSTPHAMGWITDDEGPTCAEMLPSDRILPSVQMLVDGGYILGDKVRQLLDKIP